MLELGYCSVMTRPQRRSWLALFPWRREHPIEPVELCARRFGYQPARFRWRGMLYRVACIERVWEETARRDHAARRYFAVRCGNNQEYMLFQDLQIGTWHLVPATANLAP